jgi:HD-GYP domain-containing protein (c-di-GMP phosphodiesterase class II)
VDRAEKETAVLTDVLAKLEQAYDNVLEAFGNSLGLRNAETEGHSQRVVAIAIAIGKRVPIPSNLLAILARAAFVHDIGKIAIPDSILYKPRALTDDEKKVMRSHCEIGHNTLQRIPFLRDAADIVLAHHEFFDGTGYPRGLRGEQIPLGARILSVANALDAMLSDWPYRNALPMSHAREEIWRCAGTQFDPKIVEIFLAVPENDWIELRKKLSPIFPDTSAGLVH